jgi:tripartite ATP-independent transporter DctP family solute receptor
MRTWLLGKQFPRSRKLALTVLLPCAGLAVLLCASGCSASGESSGPIELRLGHVANPGSLTALSAEEFARRVNEELAGRVHITVFGSSQLGSDEVMLIKLRLGTIDLSVPSTVMSSMVDGFGLFEMPYLVTDREHMGRIEEAIFWPELAPLAEQRGFRILAVWENGFRQVTNNSRPIVTPADLSGIKLRTPKGRWRVELFQLYGAHPTPMSLSEVFVALQTGVLDGQENPLTQIAASKFEEVQRYLSLTNHVYTPGYLVAGSEKWARLPADLRADLEGIARGTQGYVRQTGARIDEELLRRIKDSGMEVNEIDRESFVNASKAIYQRFGEIVPGGGQWIKTALALAGN